MKATDTQIGGNHYKGYSIQPIEFIHKNKLSFIQGNIIKYVCRYKEKNGVQDLEKAKHYIDLLIEMEDAVNLGQQQERVNYMMEAGDWMMRGVTIDPEPQHLGTHIHIPNMDRDFDPLDYPNSKWIGYDLSGSRYTLTTE